MSFFTSGAKAIFVPGFSYMEGFLSREQTIKKIVNTQIPYLKYLKYLSSLQVKPLGCLKLKSSSLKSFMK